ncbi:MAG: hypothetical protein ISQ08_00735 [Planctomycetes bacterium]|nr:hypothetical protein [Planctomycetota bacterium]
MPRLRLLVAWSVPSALLVVHQVAAPRGGELWLGLPEEWWLRLGWCAAAWVYLLWFARAVWTGNEAEGEGGEG